MSEKTNTKREDELNLDLFKSQAKQWEYFKKAFFRFLKAIPKTVLTQWLIEAGILKEDYLTKELSMKTNTNKKTKSI